MAVSRECIKKNLEALEHWANGGKLECRYPTSEWREIDAPVLSDPNLEYRPRPTPDYVPWEHIHSDFKFFARNKSGMTMLATVDPKKRAHYWMFSVGRIVDATCFAGFKIGNTPWDESLQVRPE